MTNIPGTARVVIIGGGVIGCSVAYHLAQKGWKEIILLERKQLTSGTTWHAAGLIAQLRASANMTKLAKYSQELYGNLEKETGVATGFKRCGSITVALTEERKEEIFRQAAMARAFGDIGLVEELLSPDLTDDFEVLRSVFRPNAKLENFVTRPTQEVGYVVSGNLNLWIENEIFELGSGDSFRIRGEQFKWANPNNEDAIVIWVIAPPIY